MGRAWWEMAMGRAWWEMAMGRAWWEMTIRLAGEITAIQPRRRDGIIPALREPGDRVHEHPGVLLLLHVEQRRVRAHQHARLGLRLGGDQSVPGAVSQEAGGQGGDGVGLHTVAGRVPTPAAHTLPTAPTRVYILPSAGGTGCGCIDGLVYPRRWVDVHPLHPTAPTVGVRAAVTRCSHAARGTAGGAGGRTTPGQGGQYGGERLVQSRHRALLQYNRPAPVRSSGGIHCEGQLHGDRLRTAGRLHSECYPSRPVHITALNPLHNNNSLSCI